ncbi:hypothetical protein ACWDV4_20795 [Micromonospora sp. NPDC003197]
MYPGQARIQLSVGYPKSGTSRVVTLSIAGGVIAVASYCLGGLLGTLRSSGGDSLLPAILALAPAAVATVVIGLMIANVVRSGAWLEGTQLTVRDLASRTVELRNAWSVTLAATAESSTGIATDGGFMVTGGITRSPVLTVVGPDATVQLRLRSREGVLIPAAEMMALANALSVAQCPGAREAASWLQAMASDPRTMLM